MDGLGAATQIYRYTDVAPGGKERGALCVWRWSSCVYVRVYVCVCARADHLSVASGPNGMNETFGNIQLSFE